MALDHFIQLHIETLPEGAYLATSDAVQGLVAQGRVMHETIEIACDVARKLIDAQSGATVTSLPPVTRILGFPMDRGDVMGSSRAPAITKSSGA